MVRKMDATQDEMDRRVGRIMRMTGEVGIPRSLTYDELQTLHAVGATLGPLTEQEDRAMTYEEIMAREA